MSTLPSDVPFVPAASAVSKPRVGLYGLVIRGVELACAALLALELLFLGAAVAARYLFNAPLYWADEFCTIVLLWLAGFAFVLALERGTHMRLTYFVDRLPARASKALESINGAVSLAFYCAAAIGCFQYALHEASNLSSGLEISMAYKVAALPVAFCAMALVQLLALDQKLGRVPCAGTVVLVGAFLCLAWLTRSVGGFSDPLWLSAAFAATTFCLVFAGLPIGVAFGAVALAYVAWFTRAPLSIVGSRFDEGTSTYVLLSIPLFVFLGQLIEMTGIAKALVDLLTLALGRVRGGLSYCMLGAMYLVSGISAPRLPIWRPLRRHCFRK